MTAEPSARAIEYSGITCPDCGGVLSQETLALSVQFRCHIGHTYSCEQLLIDHAAYVEQLLRTSCRALVEHAILERRLAGLVRAQGFGPTAERLEHEAALLESQASGLECVLPSPG